MRHARKNSVGPRLTVAQRRLVVLSRLQTEGPFIALSVPLAASPLSGIRDPESCRSALRIRKLPAERPERVDACNEDGAATLPNFEGVNR